MISLRLLSLAGDNRNLPNGTGQVGVESSHGSLQVGSKRRSGVEPEPSDPEQDCSENDVSDVVRLIEDTFGTVTPSFTDKVRVGESTDSGSDFDGDSTGV